MFIVSDDDASVKVAATVGAICHFGLNVVMYRSRRLNVGAIVVNPVCENKKNKNLMKTRKEKMLVNE